MHCGKEGAIRRTGCRHPDPAPQLSVYCGTCRPLVLLLLSPEWRADIFGWCTCISQSRQHIYQHDVYFSLDLKGPLLVAAETRCPLTCWCCSCASIRLSCASVMLTSRPMLWCSSGMGGPAAAGAPSAMAEKGANSNKGLITKGEAYLIQARLSVWWWISLRSLDT
jgi:hypothetical protein